jgi:hypothetical protein
MDVVSEFLNRFKKDPYDAEADVYKAAIRKNPADKGLWAQYAKFRLRYHFAHPEENRSMEAVEQFERLDHSDLLDPEFYYLMGRYWQGTDEKKAKQWFLEGIKRFNQYVEKNPALKNDYMEITLATALNLMTLQPHPMTPELEKYFKSIHKSYPLHIKRVELEKEIEKPTYGSARVQSLTQDMERIRKPKGQS